MIDAALAAAWHARRRRVVVARRRERADRLDAMATEVEACSARRGSAGDVHVRRRDQHHGHARLHPARLVPVRRRTAAGGVLSRRLDGPAGEIEIDRRPVGAGVALVPVERTGTDGDTRPPRRSLPAARPSSSCPSARRTAPQRSALPRSAAGSAVRARARCCTVGPRSPAHCSPMTECVPSASPAGSSAAAPWRTLRRAVRPGAARVGWERAAGRARRRRAGAGRCRGWWRCWSR